MKTYSFSSGRILPFLYPSCVWKINTQLPQVYLTFDDGPHPEITPWVRAQLDEFGFKGTFFCIGDNVRKYPVVYAETLEAGFAVGNHTFNHVNGFKNKTADYLKNIEKCHELVNSKLFRPPYGKLWRPQLLKIISQYKVIMWSVLAGDFDLNLDTDKAFEALKKNTFPGSIIIFHDSEKAKRNLQILLPKYLQFLKDKGYNAVNLE
jgi:peptidoglycan/xylan/chitin deacetylase (PgdA/CDA1 family)